MRLSTGVILAGALVLLSACGETKPATVEGRTKAAVETSVAEIAATLDPATRADFEAAIAIGWKLSEVTGKTPAEIIAAARARRIQELSKTELPALRAKRDEAAAFVTEEEDRAKRSPKFLRGLKAVDPRLSWREENGVQTPFFTFNLTNDTSEPIVRIVFAARISARGEKSPFIDQVFDFTFVDPLVTAETKFVFVKPDAALAANANAGATRTRTDLTFEIDFRKIADLKGRLVLDDEAVAKAVAARDAAEKALAAAEAELARHQANGPFAAPA